ncbi:nitrophenyl compound nitroreductase subunit ArsF family protein [Mangrovibacterium lignilyticum]|uniref:nitrophenyl compound nitroreductase subunit ArsF family protein n=1 Tax=Mangrovibacterium lignilyticum TaxID=2668052 RepID=UPI0013D4A2DA|nr:nitrophenyl compound nitroreductase subunit ArsF family protein [Mangrovibacterium lignilyticum]
MKKTIVTLTILFIGHFWVSAQCCDKSTAKVEKDSACCTDSVKATTDVKAYYFHATRRCETCQAVEEVSKEAIQEYYGNQVEFLSVNSDEDASETLIEKYKVSGQTLIIVKGNKIIDLTTDAFLNARTNPEKLKAKIKASIDPLI